METDKKKCRYPDALGMLFVWMSLGVAAGQRLAGGGMEKMFKGTGFDQTLILCQEEYFQPQCARTQVLYIQQAQYGRMRLSRCVNRDFGFVGCSRNVLPIVEAQCSGRRSCSLKVLDETFPIDPCHIDLRSYLEIHYSCIDVHLPKSSCDSATLITDTSGYLASLVTMETGCGGTEAPWVVRALPGQRLNITLFDFGTHLTNTSDAVTLTKTPDGTTNLCKVYATIKEAKGSRRNTICGGDVRIRMAYVSLGNTVEIRIYGNRGDKNHAHFFLHYQVIGCPDPEAPSGGWVKRNEQVALLGCHDNMITWQWTCSGTVWVGEQRNCTPAQLLTSSDDVSEGTIPLGLSIVIVVILALVVGATILIIGLVCLKRPNQSETHGGERKRDASAIPLRDINGDVTGDVIGDDKNTVVCALRNTQTTTTIIHRLNKDENKHAESGAENDYATTKLLTSPLQDGNGADYGDYIRGSKQFPEPCYVSRLEQPDVTNQAQPDQSTSFRTSRADHKVKADAVIVDLGTNFDPEVVPVQGRGLALDGSCACVQPASEYIYHQGTCCRHCGGLIVDEHGSREQFHNVCNLHTLGHLGHGKQATDPNCVICSLPANKSVKPSS